MVNKDFYKFDKVYIETSFKDHKNVKRILGNITYNEIEYVDDIFKLIKEKPPVFHPKDRVKELVLSGIRGDILKKCPGSHGHICCNYYVINLYVGCPIDCTYCILQAYLNQPFIIINIDIETVFNELSKIAKENPDKIFRIGTGEVGDSLFYDPVTNFSEDFIEFFKKHPNFIFEFKTKTNYVDNILKYNSPGNIVVGFSVNPEVLYKEEGYAASMDERIEAAEKLIEKGYKVALHFDPIFNIDYAKEHYENIIDKIFSKVKPSSVSWVSLGTFRYTPDLKNMIEYNYPKSLILEDEFIENADKKFRYFKPIRLPLYKYVASRLEEIDKNMMIYLCMESPDVWRDVLGVLPHCESKMDFLFRKSVENFK